MGSILYLKQCPPHGGDTLFASMYAAYEALSDRMKAYLDGLVAVHDFAWSRRRVDPALVTEAEAADHPPVRQPVVRDENPHGPALYLGAHARAIEGMAEAEGRAHTRSDRRAGSRQRSI